jgi:hypothetical protein
MSDYFKFCPKCGRVLDRDWCTHCEPEKEKAFRRQQSKMEADMFENYSKDPSAKVIFSKKPKKIKYPGKTETEVKYYDSGKESRRENREEGMDAHVNVPRTQNKRSKKKSTKEEKNHKAKRISTILIILALLISFIPSILSIFDDFGSSSAFDWIDNIFDDDDVSTIEPSYFSNLLYTSKYSDFEPKADYYIEWEPYIDDYTYYEGDEDSQETDEDEDELDGNTYGYMLSKVTFYNLADKKADTPVQQQLDAIYEKYLARAKEIQEKKLKIYGELNTVVTYYSDDAICFRYEAYEYAEDGTKTTEAYNFIVDLNSMEQYTKDDFITADDEFYETILDKVEDNIFITKSELKSRIEAGQYDCLIDQDGTLWVTLPLDLEEYGCDYYNIEFDDINFDSKTID